MLFATSAVKESPECIICFDPMQENCSRVSKLLSKNLPCLHTLSCGHRFHAHCITKWIQSDASCPICRIELCRIEFLNSLKPTKQPSLQEEAFLLSVVADQTQLLKKFFSLKMPQDLQKKALLMTLKTNNTNSFRTLLELEIDANLVVEAYDLYESQCQAKCPSMPNILLLGQESDADLDHVIPDYE